MKRAGFVGMRGKKSDDLFKRAGFVGMRGKKSVPAASQLFSPAQRLDFDKWPYYLIPYASKSRRATSGFVGMRG